MRWGDSFLDYDNDGWLDLFEVNGHVYPEVDQHEWGTSWAERPQLFHNIPDGPPTQSKDRKFEIIPPVRGTGLADVIPARGAAFGDLFNDGKIDVAINPIDGPAVLLRNVNPDRHHWVEMDLIGGKNPQDRQKEPARCHLRHRSISPPTACACARTCSRAAATSAPMIAVRTLASAMPPTPVQPRFTGPSGQIEKIKLPAADRIYTIEEGKGITAALCNGKPCDPSSPDVKAAPVTAPKNTSAGQTCSQQRRGPARRVVAGESHPV